MKFTCNLELDNEHFPLPLYVEFIDGKMWQLLTPFEYDRDNGDKIIAPMGFVFDFASIPQLFWSWVGSPTGEYGPAACIHDYLCTKYGSPYKNTDYIFYEAMQVLNIPYLKRTLMYWAVRIFHHLN